MSALRPSVLDCSPAGARAHAQAGGSAGRCQGRRRGAHWATLLQLQVEWGMKRSGRRSPSSLTSY